MPQARRCSQCGNDWPVRSEYVECPLCEGETWLNNNTTVLTHTEAQTVIRKHREEYQRIADNERAMDAAFDAWFCKQHGIVNPADALADRKSGAPLDELVC